MVKQKKTGLILTGGGARAAYQIGVLRGIAAILWEAGWPPARNPFDIICGTSAGAINATALACRADNFGEGVQRLADVGTMADADRLVARLRDDDPRVRMEAATSMWQIWSRSGDKAIDAQYQRGVQQMEASRFPEAVATFSDIIRKKPENPGVDWVQQPQTAD